MKNNTRFSGLKSFFSKQVALVVGLMMVVFAGMGQTNGDYRSTATTTSLNTATGWQVFSGGSWGTASTSPIAASTTPTNITIAGVATVNTGTNTTVFANTNLIIGDGTNAATLTVGGSSVAHALSFATITVSSTGTLTTSGTNTSSALTITGSGSGVLAVQSGGAVALGSQSAVAGRCSVTFTGSTGGTVTNLNTTNAANLLNFYTITINSGTSTSNIIDFQGAFTMATATSAATLTLTNGTFQISQSNTVSITPFGGSVTIPATAGVTLNNANATITQGSSSGTLTIAGTVTITNGTWNAGNNTNVTVTGTLNLNGSSSSNGSMTVGTGNASFNVGNASVGTVNLSGGTLTVNGNVVVNVSSTYTSTLNISSNGTLTIPSGGTVNSTNRGIFHIAGISSFNMSGGNVNIASSNSGTFASDIYISTTGTCSITGGTFTISNTTIRVNTANQNLPNVVVQNGGGTVNVQPVSNTLSLLSLTVNSGTFDNTGSNKNVTITGNGGGIANSGTFNAGTGTYTFSTGATQALSGTLSIPSVTVTSPTVLTNNGTLTVGTALSGTGTFTQGTNSTLNIGGTSGITTLTATASGNTVYYTAGTQTVKSTTYNNLDLSNTTGTQTAGGALVVNGILTTTSGGTLDMSTSNYALSVGGNFVNGGTFTARSGTVTFTGTTLISGTNPNFYAVTTSGTASVTTGVAVTISNNLSIANSGSLTVGAYALTVTGTTTVGGGTSGSLVINASATPTFTGAVTVAAGASWTNSGNTNVSFGNNLTNNSTSANFTAGTGTYTFTNASPTLAGTMSIPVLTVAVGSTLTNNGTITVGTTLTASGTSTTWTQGTNSSLTLGGAYTFTTLGASANTNTVNYSGASQTLVGVNYSSLTLSGSGTDVLQSGTTTISGNFALSGTVTTTTVVGLAVTGTLSVGDGTTLNIAGFNFSVGGATTVGGGNTGVLNITSNSGTYTFTGAVTIASGGTWNNSGNGAVSFGNNLTNNSTNANFTAGSGVYTFLNSAALAGTMSIPTLTVTAGKTLTNNGIITVGTTLTASGTSTTWTQGANSSLTLGGTYTFTSLGASANTNTVNYSGASQTVVGVNYSSLTLSGSGTDVLQSGTTTISGNFTLSGTVTTTTVANLAISGNLVVGDGTTLTPASTYSFTVGGTTSIGNPSGSGTSGTLTISSSSGTKTFTGAVTVYYNGTWNNSGNVAVNLTNGLTNNGTFTTGTNTTTIGGAFSNNGTFTAGTGTVAFNGTTSMTESATTTFYNVSITGTLTAPNATINVSGATWANTGTFTAGTGTVAFTGTGTQTISGTTSFYNLTDQTPSATLKFTSGTTQTILSGGTLTLAGNTTSGNSTFLTVTSSSGSSVANITFAGTPNASITNCNISWITNTSAPISAASSTNSGNNTNITFTNGVFYWRGAYGTSGTGTWATGAFSTSSTSGSSCGYLPGIADSVVFDAGSGTAPITVTLPSSLTFRGLSINNLSTGGGVIFSNTGSSLYAIIDTNLTVNNSQVTFSLNSTTTGNNVTIGKSITFLGSNDSIVYPSATNGYTFTLGDGTSPFYINNPANGAFGFGSQSISGAPAFSVNYSSTSNATMNFNANTPSIWAFSVVKGTLTLGSSIKVASVSFNSGNNNQILAVASGATLNLGGNNTNHFTNNGSNNAGLIDATVGNIIISSLSSTVLNNGVNMFKNAQVYSLTINTNSGYLFSPYQALIVTNLTLTSGIYNNSTNNVTIASGGTITRSSQYLMLTAAPIYGSSSSSRVNVTIAATCNAGYELQGTTGAVGTLTVNNGSTYTLSSTFVTGYTSLTAGSGYTSNPSVTISAPNITGGTIATASASQTSGGVTYIYITNPGSGYTTVPTITFSGGGGTTQATATATISTNSSLYADALSIAGTLNFANTTSLPVTLNIGGGITIASTGSISASNISNAVNHILNVGGNIANSGSISMLNIASNKAIDVTLNGSSQSLTGTGSNAFNNFYIGTTSPSTTPTVTIPVISATSVTVNSGSTLALGGTLTSSAITVNGTLQLNSSGSVSSAPTYNSTSTLSYNNGTSAANGTEWSSSNPYNVTINSGTTFTPTGDLTLLGNWSNAGTFTANSHKITFGGSASGVTITNSNGGTETFYGLTINNSNGVTLGSNVNVTSLLTLTSGILTTTGYTLNLVSTATTSGGSSSAYISGPMTYTLPSNATGSAATYTFPLGATVSSTATYMGFAIVNPTTGSGTVTFTATANGSGSGSIGSVDGTLSSIGGAYWSVSSANFTSANIELIGSSLIGSSNVVAGYNGTNFTSLGGTYVSPAVTSTTTASNSYTSFAVGTAPLFSLGTIVPTSLGFTQANTTGYYGQTITINGYGFLTATTTVSIGGTDISSSISSTTNTAITLTLPTTISTGSGQTIQVSQSGTNLTNTSFNALGYISTGSGDWNSTTASAPWLGGFIPASGSTVTINSAVTANDATATTTPPNNITINSGNSLTFGASGSLTTSALTNNGTLSMGSGGTLNLASGGSLSNSGTFTTSTSAGTMSFAGSGSITGTMPSQFYNLSLGGVVTLSGIPTIYGTLTYNSGASLNQVPTYTSNAILYYKNTTATIGTEWGSGSTVGSGVPQYITIDASADGTARTITTPSAARTCIKSLNIISGYLLAAGNLTFSSGATLNVNAGDTLDMGTNTMAATVGNFTNTGTGGIKIGGTFPYSYTNPYTWSGSMIFTSTTGYYTIYPGNYNNIDLDYSTGVSRNLDVGGGVGTGTFSIAGTMKWSGTGNIAANKTTFSFGASSTVPSGITFYNVSFSGSGSGSPTISGGTGTYILNIGNTFNPGSVTSISAGTINFTTVSGGGVTEGNQTIPAFNYNNLTIGGARTTNNIVFASSGTIGVAGTFSYSATYTTGSLSTNNSTINFNGSGQTIPAFTYNNLTNTSSGTSTLGGTVTVSGNLNNASGTLACSSYTLNIAGNFTNSGTFTAGTGTVNFNGTTGSGGSVQTVTSGLTFNNLTISNSNVTIPALLTVNGLFKTDPGTGNTLLQPVNTTITASGGLTVNSGTFSIAGTTSTLASNTASSNNAVFKLTGGTPTITGTLAIGGYFYYSGTNSYTLNTGYGFTVTSNAVYEAAFTNGVALPIATSWDPNSYLYLTGTIVNNPAVTSSSAQTFGNLIWNITSATQQFSLSSNFSNIVGTLYVLNTGASGYAMRLSTNPTIGNIQVGGSFTINGSTINAVANYANLDINRNGAGGTLAVGNVTIATNGTLSSYNTTTLNVAGNWTNNGGTFTQANTTVNFNNTSASQAINGTAASQTFNTLTLGNTGQTLTVGGSTTAITAAGLTITSGTFTAPATLTINGSLSNSGTLSAGSVINITGNWTNSGTFNSNSGTVNLTGTSQTIAGSSSFYNLAKTVSSATTLTLTSGTTQTITNLLTLAGASGQLLTIATSTGSSIATINPTNSTVTYTSISYITNSNSSPVYAFASTNGGNNTNIVFNTYTWTGATSTDYTVATNWNPSRTTTYTSDILTFNNGTVNTVTNIPTQTIYQLVVSGSNTTVNLQAGAANNVLNIAGDNNTGTYDLTVAATDSLNLTGTNELVIRLGTNATADILGNVRLDNAVQVLDATYNSGAVINFESGSTCQTGVNFPSANSSGNYPFTNINITDVARVIFKSGSKYYNNGGNSPISKVASGSSIQFVNFQTGSWYIFQQSSSSPWQLLLNNAVYSNFEWNVNYTGSYGGSTGTNFTTFDSIYVAQGSFTMSFGSGTTSNAININNGINVVSGSSFAIGSVSGITTNINFTGTATQYITGAGSVILGNTSAASTTSAVAINFNNTSGVILQSTLTNASTNPTYTLGTGATFDASSTNATLNFVQSASLTLPSALGTTIGNLSMTIGSANTLSLGAATSLNGNLTITSGTLDVTSTNNYALSVAGNFANSGTFAAQTGTVTFNGTSTISGSTTTSFNNLTIASSSTLTGKSAATFNVAGNWVNNGTYTHNSGTVNFNGTTTVSGSGITTFNNLAIAASSTLTGHSTNMNIAGTFTNSGTFNHNNGTVTFTGTSTINNSNTFYNLTTSGAGTTTFGNITTSVANNLSIGDGTTVSIPNGTFSVTGITTVGGGTSGTILFTNSSGSRTFGGLFTLNSGSTWTNSGNAAVSLNGGLTIAGAGVTFTAGTNTTTITGVLTTNGAFTASTGTFAFTGTSSITGSVAPSFNNFTVSSGTLTSSSGNINVAGTFTSTGTFTHNSGTVTFNGGGAQSISSPVTFYNLTTTGTGTAVSIGNNTTNINGALNIGDGTSFTIVAATVTVTGTTTIGSGSGSSAKLITSNTSGTRTFIGAVTINSNGWFNNTAGSSDIFQGGITNNGTLDGNNSGYGYTFNTNSQSISGSGTFGNIYNLTVTGTGIVLTNNVSLTITNLLSGTGGLTQGSSSTLNLGATPTITALTASASGNTINFNGSGTQTIPANSYYNLTISGTRTTNNVTLVSGGTINIAGTYSNTASFAGGSLVSTNNTINLNGTSNQSIDGSTFNNLTVNNSAGVTLNGNVTVNGTLTLTAGRVTTGSNTLSVTSTSVSAVTATASFGTGAYINGTLIRSVVSANSNYVFPVGQYVSSTDYYYPFTLNTNTASGTVNVTVVATKASSGGSVDGTTVATISPNEYWQATTSSTLTGTVSVGTAAIGSYTIIGTSTTLAGTYSSLGGLLSGTNISNSSSLSIPTSSAYFVVATTAIAPPTITSIVSCVPTTATNSFYARDTITINGTGFISTSVVNVGGQSATILDNTGVPTVLKVLVSSSANSNVVTVSNVGGTTSYSSGTFISGYVSRYTGSYGTGSTWLGGSVPASNANITICTTVTMASTTSGLQNLTINSGATLTCNNIGMNYITGAVITNNGTITSSNTMTFAGTLAVVGSSTTQFSSITLNGLTTFTTAPLINGTMTLNSGSSIATHAPAYGSSSVIAYNVGGTVTPGVEWTAGATSGAGVPYRVNVNNGNTLSLSSGTYTVLSLLAAYGNISSSGGSLNLSNSSFWFAGTSAQTINIGTAQPNVYSISIANAAGTTLQSNITITHGISFQSGVLTTSGSNLLTIASSVSASSFVTSSSSYINGPLARVITNTTRDTFPIGIGGVYQPITFAYASTPSSAETVTITPASSIPGTVPSNVSTAQFGTTSWNLSQSATGYAYTIGIGNGSIINTSGGSVVIARREGTGSYTNSSTSLSSSVYTSTSSFSTSNVSNDVFLAETNIPLTVTGAVVNNKSYDGTTSASLSTVGTLSGILSGDAVSIASSSVAFSSKNVGTGISITTNYTITGTNAGAYSVTQPSLVANINALGLTITANDQSKNYGTSLSGTSTQFTSSGLLSGETIGTVSLNYSGGGAASAAAGTYSIIPSNPVASSGNPFSASNYSITYVDGTLTVNVGSHGVWTGIASTSYNNVLNWADGQVPSAGDNVIINTGATYYPVMVSNDTIGSIVIASGTTLGLGGDTLTINGEIDGSGTLTSTAASSLILNGTTGTINFTSGGNTIQNLTLNTGASATLGTQTLIASDINAGTVTIGSGATLNTGDNLVLLSDSLGTASIAQLQGTLSGNVTVQRYISAKTARVFTMVGSPVTESIHNAWQQQVYITGAGSGGAVCSTPNSNGFDATQTNTPSMYTYDSVQVSGSRWISVPNTSGNLTPGVGYKMNIRGDRTLGSCLNELSSNSPAPPTAVTLSATGNVDTGNVVVALHNPLTHLYSLVANPYPSTMSFTNLYLENEGNINYNMWTFSPFGNGNYTTFSGGIVTNAASGYGGLGASGDNIASGQAFFVQAANPIATSASITFQEADKVNQVLPNTQYFGAAVNKMLRVGLKTSTNTNLDEIVVRFKANGSPAYNPKVDAASLNAGSQVLVALKANNKVAIATYPDDTNADTALLGVSSTSIGTFRLLFSDYAGIDASRSITLVDNFLGTTQDVRANQVYDFNVTSNTASQGNNRFVLVFGTETNPLPVSFTSVTATKNNTGAAVNWSVANQLNIANYEVERSIDGSNYASIATAKATSATTYAVEDKNIPTIASTLYYRIKSIGVDGSFKYSNVASLKLSINNYQLSIFPNPVQDKLNITIGGATNGTYAVRILTVAGKEVMNRGGIAANGNTIKLDASNLASGVYMLELTDATGNKQLEKFVKD